MKFRSDCYLKLRGSFEELIEKENGLPLIEDARGGMNCSVLKVGGVEVGIWQVSGNDAVDSDSRDL